MKIVPVERVMSPAEATRMVGGIVGDLDPRMPAEGPLLMTDAADGHPVMLYLPVENVTPLRQTVLHMTMGTTLRAGAGLRNKSRTFGMAPRKPVLWREGCAPTSLARDDPQAMAVLAQYAGQMRDTLNRHLPDQVAQGKRAVADVLPEWRLAEDALWTSGVINDTSTLPYHRDRFNFDAWSAMPVVRRGTRGGYLHVPEYDLVVPCRDGWALFWSGFQLVHGVTPIRKVEPDGYRFSVVYYALRGMKDCLTAALETKYANARRTEREHIEGGSPLVPDDDGDPYGRLLADGE